MLLKVCLIMILKTKYLIFSITLVICGPKQETKGKNSESPNCTNNITIMKIWIVICIILLTLMTMSYSHYSR